MTEEGCNKMCAKDCQVDSECIAAPVDRCPKGDYGFYCEGKNSCFKAKPECDAKCQCLPSP
jgi:hypothetical protein